VARRGGRWPARGRWRAVGLRGRVQGFRVPPAVLPAGRCPWTARAGPARIRSSRRNRSGRRPGRRRRCRRAAHEFTGCAERRDDGTGPALSCSGPDGRVPVLGPSSTRSSAKVRNCRVRRCTSWSCGIGSGAPKRISRSTRRRSSQVRDLMSGAGPGPEPGCSLVGAVSAAAMPYLLDPSALHPFTAQEKRTCATSSAQGAGTRSHRIHISMTSGCPDRPCRKPRVPTRRPCAALIGVRAPGCGRVRFAGVRFRPWTSGDRACKGAGAPGVAPANIEGRSTMNRQPLGAAGGKLRSAPLLAHEWRGVLPRTTGDPLQEGVQGVAG
jgi:hypothetical protein